MMLRTDKQLRAAVLDAEPLSVTPSMMTSSAEITHILVTSGGGSHHIWWKLEK
jgi:hypothetical protein